jgi:CBS domain-containing protein
MTRDPRTVSSGDPVIEAARIMSADDIGDVIVVDGGRVEGIVTDRDIVVRALADGRNAHREPVRNVMSSKVLCCFEDQSVEEAAALMAEHGFRRLPVLDRRESLVGIVSLSDVRGGASGRKPYAVTFYKELPDGSVRSRARCR